MIILADESARSARPRVLQFGAGNYGKFHVEAWRKFPVDLRVVDPNPPPGNLDYTPQPQASERDWEWADIVDVVTPVKDHYLLAMIGLDSGCDVFVEKPLSTFVTENQLLAENQERGRAFVGYGYRFAPGIRELKDRLTKETPQLLKVEFYANKEPRKDTNLMWSDGVHCLDLLGFLWPRQLETPKIPSRDLRRYQGLMAGARHNIGFQVSNNLRGAYPDPVIPGAMTTKRVIAVWMDESMTVVDFSEVNPVDLLVAQFTALLGDKKDLATAQESLEIARILS